MQSKFKIIEDLKAVRRTLIKKNIDRRKFNTKYCVEGNPKGHKKMLYVLSGYKPFLWDDIFERIKKLQLDDMDVCIGSSGKYCAELSALCKENDWVYVSTKLNNICVLTNIIIRLFDKAEYIFKLDEDIYISNGYFEDMFNAYLSIEAETPGEIGYICPVLPLGFYGMHDFLVKTGSLSEYEENFGKHRKGGTVINPSFRKGVGIDQFIWEKIGPFDERAAEYRSEPFSYEGCTIRSGIAAILFTRRFWDEMGGLIHKRGAGLGDFGDEGQITSYCALHFQMSFCVKNILVGHFSFGGSEPQMLEFKKQNPSYFELKV